MLKGSSERTGIARAIRVETGCEALKELLCSLLAHWKYEIRPDAGRDVLLLAEEGCAVPVEGQDTIWLVRSPQQGGEGSLGLPLEFERLWQVLEYRFHRPPRMHIRMDVEIDASVTIDNETVRATLSSLSDMGCRFPCHRELIRNQPVILSLPVAGEVMRIDSRVIYAIHPVLSSDRDVRVGLLFSGLEKEQRDILRAYLMLCYLRRVRSEMTTESFARALGHFALPDSVRESLGG